MSCSSCHDPHSSPSPAERTAFFRAKCLACHSAPAFAAAYHPANPDCTSCHMPRTGAQNTPHVAWTDHRILRTPQSAPPAIARDQSAGLVPIFSPEADDRDLALATYNATMSNDLDDRAGALQMLQAVHAAGAHDPALLEALGALSAMTGNAAQARSILEQLLEKDPANLTALSDLAVYKARAGDLQGAITLWKSAFSRNQDDLALARNLAITECAAGNSDQAKQTLLRALSFSPGNRKAWAFSCDPAQR